MEDETIFLDIRDIDLKDHKTRPPTPKKLRKKKSDDSIQTMITTAITMKEWDLDGKIGAKTIKVGAEVIIESSENDDLDFQK